MKLPSRRRFIGIAAASSALGLLPWRALASGARPQAGLEPVVWRGVALGADAELHLLHPDRDAARRLIDSAVDELRRLETVFSLYRDDSALAVLNRQGHLNDPPADLLRLLSESRRFSVLTGGVFDPTVQPLWQLYAGHFSQPGADPDGPPPARLREALAKVSHAAVVLDSRAIRYARPGMAVTLNGIAQGYITDRVTDLLRRGGLDRALVDMGEIYAMGERGDGQPWRAGLADPDHPDALAGQVTLRDRALATSGGYGTPIDAAGCYTHLFDPRDGNARPRYRSVSVMAPTATAADALSTAFSHMPLEDAKKIARSLGLRAWFTLPDGGRARLG
ncbi:MAG: FAD:protein FMN transferase [Achromobacter sp.]|nr:FAD:protein FMN transferase [Achromobacter sp.]